MISVGIYHWYRLKEYEPEESIYAELKLLGRKYRHYRYVGVDAARFDFPSFSFFKIDE